MNEKLVELENALIVEYPARLQKDQYKRQFTYPIADAIEFDLKLKDKKNKPNIMRFRVRLEGKTYIISCALDKKQCKKIKDIIKFLDYMIENA